MEPQGPAPGERMSKPADITLDVDVEGGSVPPALGPIQPAVTLAMKIDRCMRTMHPPERGEWTYREVSEGVAELGVSLSASYIYQLRVGRRDNPTIKQIEALAQFFSVPGAYFLGNSQEADAIDAEIALLQALRTRGAADLALRASALSPRALRAVAAVITEMEARAPRRPPRRRRRSGATPADERPSTDEQP